MAEANKQQLWNEFKENGDIFSYLAYRGCPAPAADAEGTEEISPVQREASGWASLRQRES